MMFVILCVSYNDKVLFLWLAFGNDVDDGVSFVVFVYRKLIIDFRWFEDDDLDGRLCFVFFCVDELVFYFFVLGMFVFV